MNLTKTAYAARIAVATTFAAVMVYLVYIVVAPMVGEMLTSLFPPKNPPNPIYGLLDPLEFIEQPISNSTVEYVLNTKTGRLPTNLPKIMTVYKYATPRFSYQAGKDAQRHAATLGFTDGNLVTDLKSDVYQWKDPLYNSKLDIKINSRELKMETPLSANSSIYSPGLINTTTANETAVALFTGLERLSDQLYVTGKQKVTFGKILGSRAVLADSQLEAQFARIDFFRSIREIPILGPNPKEGLLNAVVATDKAIGRLQGKGAASILKNPNVEAYDWGIDQQSNATYPLLPVDRAWEVVVASNAVISNITPRGKSPFESYVPVRVDRVLINDIYLAYYDNKKSQKYLQPIYVFEGNYTTTAGDKGDITLYLPAIHGTFVKSL
ncbi:MAG: hypothetical protein UX79_C0022G0002 [candidate division WWE3 bacterium GW2011_GWB1_47_11]|uniref:Uncharacterized protein n=2 Tax=Katanobacteria TaxID=422282 RepID=A0A0G1RIV5_UNCKA|nr:MAG: hypothetical protein UX79_C0022G0002 [candidate division WWE3 bacterium GW2011_GWB1_47_11]